jgi:hypothetical protein
MSINTSFALMLCTYLSIANNLKDLAKPAASDPLHNLIRRLIAFCEPRTLWHDCLIELRVRLKWNYASTRSGERLGWDGEGSAAAARPDFDAPETYRETTSRCDIPLGLSLPRRRVSNNPRLQSLHQLEAQVRLNMLTSEARRPYLSKH